MDTIRKTLKKKGTNVSRKRFGTNGVTLLFNEGLMSSMNNISYLKQPNLALHLFKIIPYGRVLFDALI